MTVVNFHTGEIVDITEVEVRASVRRVIDHAESIWDEWAWQVENKTWTILGYGSWDEMRRGEYGALTSVAAPRAERPELVARFRGAGLTQKETASTLGITERTVQRNDVTPGSRGPSRNTTNDVFPEGGDDIVDAELVDDEPPAPRATPRRALPDQFFDAAYDAAKKVESLHRLTGDDRFPQNAKKIAAKHRNDLLRAHDLLQQVINSLPETEATK